MSVSLLIISHDNVGEALLAAATGILGLCPLHAATLAVAPDDSQEDIGLRATSLLQEIAGEEGTLVLTDLLGSTPCNIASTLVQVGHVSVVAGLNLPMLLRVLSHYGDSLQQLVDIALEGGRQGIVTGKAQSLYQLPRKVAGRG